jgi:hypothetical protein
MVWYGIIWYGMVWYGMVWYGMVWYGMVWMGVDPSLTTRLMADRVPVPSNPRAPGGVPGKLRAEPLPLIAPRL